MRFLIEIVIRLTLGPTSLSAISDVRKTNARRKPTPSTDASSQFRFSGNNLVLNELRMLKRLSENFSSERNKTSSKVCIRSNENTC
ncbi:hypothetical protein HanRHA438_Chr17g0819551 [Helianthus annuus]|nr:hypothetical protein HanRHA438_Chr17g0819551 [Helianthus annuus]